MTTLTLAPPERPRAPVLDIPPLLPHNARGERLRHLSYSAVKRFQGCPEDYRRSYIKQQWGTKTGLMFVGSRVDDTLTAYFRHQLEGQQLDLDALTDVFNELWKTELAVESSRNGPIRWLGSGLTADTAHALGREALALAMTNLVPHLGRPTAVQRRFEMKIHADLHWSIVGIVDLDTIREQTVYITADGAEHASVRDHGEQEPLIAFRYLDAPPESRTPSQTWRGAGARGGDRRLAPRERRVRGATRSLARRR